MSDAAETIHASCVVIGEAGVLIRGRSGSGKSTLAREMVLHTLQAGRFGCLVSDDRTRLRVQHGRLLASPVEPLAGHLEIHGLGITRQPYEPSAVIRLVIDLSEDPPRAREALIAVEETGRQALGEMRRLLGILRGDEHETRLAPQPGLADIDALVEHVRAAGLPVDVVVDGTLRGRLWRPHRLGLGGHVA